MKGELIELQTYTGLTPAKAKASQELWDEVWNSVRKAQENGLSTGMLVSTLDIIKVAVINEFLNQED